MKEFFPVFFSIVAIGILSAVEILLLKKLHADWWKHRWVRLAAFGVPVTGVISLALWALGIATEADLMEAIGAYGAAATLVTGLALMLSLPASGVFHIADNVLYKFRKRKHARLRSDEPTLAERRKVLKTSAAVFPVLAVIGGAKGVTESFKEPLMPVVPLAFPKLPLALEGLRVLHISDVHIGLFLRLPELERMVERSAETKPDLVLITGDFSDDVGTYFDALNIARQIPSRYGTFASIGNHEYFRGIAEIRRAYERGPIPLLLDEGVALDIGGSELFIAGADDPRTLKRATDSFFTDTIEASIRNAHTDAFIILMSHRPEGFDYAARMGIDLTLAGHTHGGQIGFNGRSMMEHFAPHKYMWGLYEKGESKLYTSAGAGHWFPYRLGCPAEIPLYVLKKSA